MPVPPPTILWPIEGSTIYHHQPVIAEDIVAPPGNGYWWFKRSSVPGYDAHTMWRMVPNGNFGQIVGFTLPGITGIWFGAFGDGTWQLDCAGRSEDNQQTEWSSYGVESQFLSFQYQPYPPDPIPTASFTNSPKEFFESKTVQFNDTSSGNPTSWSWKYRASDSGDAWVEFSTLQNPTKDFSV